VHVHLLVCEIAYAALFVHLLYYCATMNDCDLEFGLFSVCVVLYYRKSRIFAVIFLSIFHCTVWHGTFNNFFTDPRQI